MVYKIAVCDDNKIYHKYIEKCISTWEVKKGVSVKVVNYYSAEKFINEWEKNKDINLAILDIEMEEITGLELSKYIRKTDDEISIIFLTGYSEYVLEGYDVSALNYLLKPTTEEKIIETIDKAYDEWANENNEEEFLMVKSGKEIVKVKLDNIKYFIMFSHYLDIVTTNGTIKWKKKIGDLEKQMEEKGFVRCHRSYVVNTRYIKELKKDEVILLDNTTIPISISRLNNVRNVLLTLTV